jgi:hypothetical protein
MEFFMGSTNLSRRNNRITMEISLGGKQGAIGRSDEDS